jgi:LacI family transcriptional regulator
VTSRSPVTGFDDIARARHIRPTLSTVRQPMRDIGETAVATLLDRLADRTAPRMTTVLPTALVLRASCGCSARGGQK